MIHKYYAQSLEEVIECITDIQNSFSKNNGNKMIWFRGHEYTYYNLEPNIFRNVNYSYNDQKTYSNNHLREDYRYQHFMARNFDKTDYRQPRSVFEWQEVMQHFFAKTRLMDWSENLFSSLEFALEAFMIPYKNLEIANRRQKAQPALWVLQPQKLNSMIYETIKSGQMGESINNIFADFEQKTIDGIIRELDKKSHIYFSLNNEDKFDGIVSLTALEDLKHSYDGREKRAVETYEFNPFFYILLRIYADGIPVEWGTVPPLAIIHPYHSERIKAQKGVFTVFPYYIIEADEEYLKSMGFNPIAMEYMDKCQGCLCEIQMLNPEKIAEQLRSIGYKDSDLYPDSQRTAQEMENGDYTV